MKVPQPLKQIKKINKSKDFSPIIYKKDNSPKKDNQPREKDRLVKHAIIYLIKWKGLRQQNKADKAALILNMSKKTLDDYQTQFKVCFKMGYNFQNAVKENLRMSDLRSFKRGKIADGMDDFQVTKEEKRIDMENLYNHLQDCYIKYNLKNELLEDQQQLQKQQNNKDDKYQQLQDMSTLSSLPNTPALSSQSLQSIQMELNKQNSIEINNMVLSDNKGNQIQEEENEDMLNENNTFLTLMQIVESEEQLNSNEQQQQQQNAVYQTQNQENIQQNLQEYNLDQDSQVVDVNNKTINDNTRITDTYLNNKIESFNNILENDLLYDSNQKSCEENILIDEFGI